MNCPRCQQENGLGEVLRGVRRAAGPLVRELRPSDCSPTAKFCPECAHPTALATTTPTADRFASPESYTPKHLAEKILTSKAALEGERKQVTVLFADLKGSMELLADRDPEEARKLLDPVLERMMEAVHRYEGTVNQVMGDGIMALFGAPLAHEDHAVRACYAALRMQESVAQYAEGVFRSHGVPIQIRVGLNSGEVVVRAIGSDLHMDYTAVGQTTHLAARMEQMATPGTILLAPATLQLAEGYVQVAARGPVAVKGLADPVEIYALTGASAQRTRLHAAAARGLTRFVGRDAEIEQIRRALALAQDGHGQLVAVVGEPGVGKSRLVYEFTHSHRTQDWLILEAELRVLRQGDQLPARHRPPQGLLQGARSRDPPRDPREGDRQAPHAGSDPRADPARLAGPARRARRGRPVAGARSRPAPAAHPRRRQAPPAPGEPGATGPRGLRGPALDRCRDAGPARRPGRESAHGPAPPAGQLPARVPAWLGEQDLLQPAAARRAPARERGRAPERPPGRRPGAGAPQAPAGQARATPSSSRRASGRWWRRVRSPGSAAPIV